MRRCSSDVEEACRTVLRQVVAKAHAWCEGPTLLPLNRKPLKAAIEPTPGMLV
jgi:hypothetical protein